MISAAPVQYVAIRMNCTAARGMIPIPKARSKAIPAFIVILPSAEYVARYPHSQIRGND